MKTSLLALAALLLVSSSSAFAPHAPLIASRSVAARNSGSTLVMKDYPKPNLEDTDNYRNFEAMSTKFRTTLKAAPDQKKRWPLLVVVFPVWCVPSIWSMQVMNLLSMKRVMYWEERYQPGKMRMVIGLKLVRMLCFVILLYIALLNKI